MSRRRPLVDLSKPVLLVVEGRGDYGFFRRLTEHLHLSDVSVAYPGINDTDGSVSPHGRPGFGNFLLSIQVNEAYRDVEAIVVISDFDDDPDASVEDALSQIAVADLPKPAREGVVAVRPGAPAVALMMLPVSDIRRPGSLETLACEATFQQWSWASAIDDYVAATEAATWSANKKAKLKLHAVVATANAKHPDTGFVAHWDHPPAVRIDVAAPSFDGLRTELVRLITEARQSSQLRAVGRRHRDR